MKRKIFVFFKKDLTDLTQKIKEKNLTTSPDFNSPYSYFNYVFKEGLKITQILAKKRLMKHILTVKKQPFLFRETLFY